MNSENQFLQLRQRDAEVVRGNGDYTVKLQTPLIIEQGSQVALNKAIIDSRSVNSGKVVLEDDTNIKIDFNYYVTNYSTTGKQDINNNAWSQADIDADYYIWSNPYSHGSNSVVTLENIVCQTTLPPIVLNAFNMNVSYYPVGGTKRINQILQLVPVGDVHSAVLEAQFPPFNVMANASTPDGKPPFIILNSQHEMEDNGIDTQQIDIKLSPVTATNNHYEPFTNAMEIQIPKGSYDPEDLAERMSEAFTILNDDVQVGYPRGNPLLLNTEDTLYSDFTGGLWLKQNGEVNSTSTGLTQFKGAFKYGKITIAKRYYFGTNQLVFKYDQGSQRFFIEFNHMPLYNSNSEIIVAMKQITTATNTFSLVSANGGILFRSLSATSAKTGESIDFWQGKLGFDLGKLCCSVSHIRNGVLGSGGKDALVPKFSGIKIGSSITSGETGVDVLVDKSIAPEGPLLSNISPTIGTQTNPIRAEGVFSNVNFNTGYYLIEINGLNTELITENDIKSHILGIVGKYYENENYTTGSTDDAIVYTHQSPVPLVVNELKIRILDSDYNLASAIGEDNTIFLQHFRPSPQEVKEEKKSN